MLLKIFVLATIIVWENLTTAKLNHAPIPRLFNLLPSVNIDISVCIDLHIWTKPLVFKESRITQLFFFFFPSEIKFWWLGVYLEAALLFSERVSTENERWSFVKKKKYFSYWCYYIKWHTSDHECVLDYFDLL